MNRGSPDADIHDEPCGAGFNEAPIHESGKSCWRTLSRSSSSSFNEAPIHESGKCAGRAAAGPAVLRFNEAPIHESGKSSGPM